MSEKTEKEKMLAGELYRSLDPVLIADAERAQRLVAQYNATSGEATELRMARLRQLCGSVRDGTVVRPLFAYNYGYIIRLWRNVFINFNCVFLDCAPIEIGDNLQMGPLCRSIPRRIRLRRMYGDPAWNMLARSTLETMYGSEAARSFFRA
ncbi:MAG TPA: maltose acetyltransferase domain-containing protein [Candidatus Deferrimicrobium sp.]|nr:maltose acetyltransferase domain-containing protein [Candidatus Deferrimicrobium sp.]